MFISIAQSVAEWLETVLFGEVVSNAWYTANRDTIIGISIVIVCALVFVFAALLVALVWRFFERCLDIRL